MNKYLFLLIYSSWSTVSLADPPAPTSSPVKLMETQYWVYSYEENQLSFNSPWDKEEGDAIKRDSLDLPPYAVSCADKSVGILQNTLKENVVAAKLQELNKKNASQELVLLVNVLPSGASGKALRELDRDAYFSHWNDQLTRPHLALSNYKIGQWVWEVIASPEACTQPSQRELLRYLDYALERLSKI